MSEYESNLLLEPAHTIEFEQHIPTCPDCGEPGTHNRMNINYDIINGSLVVLFTVKCACGWSDEVRLGEEQ